MQTGNGAVSEEELTKLIDSTSPHNVQDAVEDLKVPLIRSHVISTGF